MPIRQMKESLEQHIVIKTQVQSTMNQAQKNSKTTQNGKSPQEPQNGKIQHQNSPPTKNRGRRRGRGGRKSDQGDIIMRPSSRPCTTSVHKQPVNGVLPPQPVKVNGGPVSMEMGFPTSSKNMRFAQRPGFGQLGTKCIVKANHFFAELPDKDLHHYD
ncbi:hypothetical protein MKW94_023797, partial [Papaver nudicaule]|nr:hypothetical protein [Papaver nudicaule]